MGNTGFGFSKVQGSDLEIWASRLHRGFCFYLVSNAVLFYGINLNEFCVIISSG